MDVLDKLLFDLHTIASIPSGKRISTAKEFIVIDDDSPIQGFWRWKAADDRYKAVRAICERVCTTTLIAKLLFESKYFNIAEGVNNEKNDKNDEKYSERVNNLKQIYAHLIACKGGINNLQHTYENDADVVGHLSPAVIELDKCVQDIKKFLTDIGENIH